jgi:hypothetical protein
MLTHWFRARMLLIAAGALCSMDLPALAAALVGRPLLVAVELSPGLKGDAAEIRRAIREELELPVVAPSQANAGEIPNELIVAVTRRQIVVSVQSADSWSSRAVEAPTDPEERLRTIAWLAGNLARDQMTGLLIGRDGPAPEPAPSATTPAAQAPDASARHSPAEPSPAAVGLEPPQFPVVAAQPALGDDSVRWHVTGSGGPSMAAFGYWGYSQTHVAFWQPGLAWRLEVTRSRGDHPLFGVALDIGPADWHLLGVAATWTGHHERKRWILETSAGLGVELGKGGAVETSNVDSTKLGTYTTTEFKLQNQPGLYASGDVAAGVRLGASFDLIADVRVHLTTLGLVQSYAVPTLGLRFRVP